jgi:hypothetical protein
MTPTAAQREGPPCIAACRRHRHRGRPWASSMPPRVRLAFEGAVDSQRLEPEANGGEASAPAAPLAGHGREPGMKGRQRSGVSTQTAPTARNPLLDRGLDAGERTASTQTEPLMAGAERSVTTATGPAAGPLGIAQAAGLGPAGATGAALYGLREGPLQLLQPRQPSQPPPAAHAARPSRPATEEFAA